MSFGYAEIEGPSYGTIANYWPFYGWRVGTSGSDWLAGDIPGYSENDFIAGLGGNDAIYGYNGNDTLDGGAGNDRLYGGLGNDTASYLSANHGVIANLAFGTAKTLGAGPVDDDYLYSIENLIGSYYDDHFQGDDLHNRLDGGSGNDVLMGWGGDDLLIGGFGQDIIVGGDGQDTVQGGFDNDTLQGNDGFDTVDYSYSYDGVIVSLANGTSRTATPGYIVDEDTLSGFEAVIGSVHADTIEGDNADNTLRGEGGRDTLRGGAGRDTLLGGEGDDVLDGGPGADVVDGGTGIDRLDFRSSGNVVGVDLAAGRGTLGDALWDTYLNIEDITGTDHAAGDVLTGNDLANRIEGLGGNDVIYGRGGHDVIEGGYGSDVIDAGAGNDMINAGGDADRIDGGLGIDTASFVPSYGGIDPIGPGVTVNLRAGTVSGLDNDGETIVNVENVIGTQFDDTLIGSDLRNTLRGGWNQDTIRGLGGDDTLCGEDGNDALAGDAGADTLYGGRGRDLMTGGADADTFLFRSLADSGLTTTTRDVVRDFQKGLDLIDLSAIDAKAGVAGDQGFLFIGADAFTQGGAGQLRATFVGTNTLVEADVNGDATADFQIVLTGQITLSALDFVL